MLLVTVIGLSAILGFYFLSCMALYFFQERIVFFPVVLPKDYVFRFNASFKEVSIDVAPSVQLNALVFEADHAKGVVVYHHGNARCLVDWASNFPDFLDRGYTVLFYDYRGYGKSDGKIVQEKQLLADAEKVYGWVKEHYPSLPIVQFGRSLGSGIAAFMALKYPCDKLILETPYYSILKMGKRLMPFLPIFSILKYKMQTWKRIQKVECPVYIFHGTHDELIPYQDAVQLSELVPTGKLVSIPQGSHNNLPMFPTYQQELSIILS